MASRAGYLVVALSMTDKDRIAELECRVQDLEKVVEFLVRLNTALPPEEAQEEVLAIIQRNQVQPLGREFEAVWDQNTDRLYET